MSDESNVTLVCYNHPNRETLLRCNRCDRPICNECAVLTPTGYRCKECVRGQQKIFDTAKPIDYVLAVVVALVLDYIGGFLTFAGFFIIFIAPVAGVIIGEAVRRIIQRRRSIRLFQATTAAVVIGGLFHVVPTLISFFAYGNLNLFGIIWQVVYISMAASTVYYRLSGIKM
ncbi:MAG: hypothetical protein ABFD29_04870 [Anaerolineaceae bacterium]